MAQQKPVQLDLFRQLDYIHVGKGLDVLEKTLNTHITNADTMVRYAAISAKEVFDQWKFTASVETLPHLHAIFFGIDVKMNPKRIQTFKNNCMCVGCGRVGNTFLIERHKNNKDDDRHFNLYSVTDKDMVLMTVDHILPDSMAGRFTVSNFQTMCSKCNTKKQNSMSLYEIAAVRANPTAHVKSWAHLPYVMLMLDMQEKLCCTRDPYIRSRWKNALDSAISRLDSKKADKLPGFVANLQSTIQQLNSMPIDRPAAIAPTKQKPKQKPKHKPKQPVIQTPQSIPPTFGQNIRNWFDRLKSIRIVMQQRTA